VHNIAPLQDIEPDPIDWATGFILTNVGLPVSWDKTNCDATLNVNVSAQALGANYTSTTDNTTRYCYSGAHASVNLSLSGNGNSTLRSSGEGNVDVTEYVSGCPGKDDAPFQVVWETGLLQALDALFGKVALVAALRHPLTADANFSGVTEEGLKDSSFEELFPLLMPGVAAGDGATAVYAAKRFGAKAAPMVPYIINILAYSSNSLDLDQLAEALGLVGPAAKDAVPVLIGILNNEYSFVTTKAAEALGLIGPDAAPAVPALLEALAREEDETARYIIIIALGNIGPGAKEAVPALIEACQSGGQYDRTYAIMALGQIGPEARAAVPALIQIFSSDSDFDRENAAKSLAAITGQDFGLDAAGWQNWWDSQGKTP
jgi:HEAT repeat protein